MTFTANIGTADRLIRLVAGLALIALALTGQIGAWGWIGVVPLATAFLRVCPLYTLLGLRTCEKC
jgi:O-antigen ligase